MKKTIITILCSVAALSALQAQQTPKNDYWNIRLQIDALRLAPPPLDYQPEYIDLNGDGKPDAIKSVTRDGMGVLWLDDDGNMKQGDLEGDMVNDCLLIDSDLDGVYDIVVKHADLDGDGKADIHLFADYPRKGVDKNRCHYMFMLDTDKDGIFNCINWNTNMLECWAHHGLSDFYTDYSGQSAFLKLHGPSNVLPDPGFNWENPFLFYDPDKDGLSEMAMRICDAMGPYGTFNPQIEHGNADLAQFAFDLDNDNAHGNDFDFDMAIKLTGKGFNYRDAKYPLRNWRGLPEADKYFVDPRIRTLEYLIYPDHDKVWDYVFKGSWNDATLVFDEDDDCARWERVEFYDPKDPFKVGTYKGGIDSNMQSDPAGDRGEWDSDFSGKGNLYVSRFDGRIHLYGAEWGCWRVDQNAKYFHGYHRTWASPRDPDKFATVKYEDTDNNGFIDKIEYDLDGDRLFETVVSLKEIGIDDRCDIYEIRKMKYKDYTSLYRKVAENMWANAEKAVEAAKKYGVETAWYARFLSPHTLREKYDHGYWLQFYLYNDLLYKFAREKSDEKLVELTKAYYSASWDNLK